MQRRSLFAFSAALTVVMLLARGVDLPLVIAGDPGIVMMRATDSPPSAQVAVLELGDHLSWMAGLELPVQTIVPGDRRDGTSLSSGGYPILVGASRVTRRMGLIESALASEG